jgi:hypothetical protein
MKTAWKVGSATLARRKDGRRRPEVAPSILLTASEALEVDPILGPEIVVRKPVLGYTTSTWVWKGTVS